MSELNNAPFIEILMSGEMGVVVAIGLLRADHEYASTDTENPV